MKLLKAFKVIHDKRSKKKSQALVPSPSTSVSSVEASLVPGKQPPAQKNLDDYEALYFQDMADACHHPDVLDVKRRVFGAQITIKERFLRTLESRLPVIANITHVTSSTTAIVNRSSTTLVGTPRVFQLNDVKVVAELGNGASGIVYKIEDKLTSATLALKVIQKKGLTPFQVEDVIQEQVALQKMAGELGFLQLEASFHDSENFYLATTYHPVGDLASILEKYGSLPPALVRFYAADLILGLEVLHSRGIIHRDIKPANILVDTTGRLVIADLGLAKVFDVDSTKMPVDFVTPYWLLPEGSQFVSYATCGSPAYCAPERMCSYKYSFGSDLWSLAISVYEMLTERVPWYSNNIDALAKSIMTDDLVFEDDDNIDERTQQFLQQMLAKDPRERLTGPDIKAHPYFRDFDWEGMIHRTISAPFVPISGAPPPCKIKGMDQIEQGDSYDAFDNPDPFPTYTFNSPNIRHTALHKDAENDNNEIKCNRPRKSGFAFKNINRHIRNPFRPHALARDNHSVSITNQSVNHLGLSGAVKPQARDGSKSTMDGFGSMGKRPTSESEIRCAVSAPVVPVTGASTPCRIQGMDLLKPGYPYNAFDNPDPSPIDTCKSLDIKYSALPKNNENDDNKLKCNPPKKLGFAFKNMIRNPFRPHALAGEGQGPSIKNKPTNYRPGSSGAVGPQARGGIQTTLDGFGSLGKCPTFESEIHGAISAPVVPVTSASTPYKIQGMDLIKPGCSHDAFDNPDPPIYACNSPDAKYTAFPKDDENDNSEIKCNPPRKSGFALKNIIRNPFRPHALARDSHSGSITNQSVNHPGSSGTVELQARGGRQSTTDGLGSLGKCPTFESEIHHTVSAPVVPVTSASTPCKIQGMDLIKPGYSHDAFDNPDPSPIYTCNSPDTALPKNDENDSNGIKCNPPRKSGFAFKNIGRRIRNPFRPHALVRESQSASVKTRSTNYRPGSFEADESQSSSGSQTVLDDLESSSECPTFASPDGRSDWTLSPLPSIEGLSLRNSACSSGRTLLHSTDFYNPSMDSILPISPLLHKTNIHPHPVPSIGKRQPDYVSANLFARTKLRLFGRWVGHKVPRS